MQLNTIFSMLLCLAIGFQVNGQCYNNTHTPLEADSWRSCEETANPNPERPVSHWIMYDLGYEYTLDSTYIWNYNAWGNSEMGVKDAVIDYSLDGADWTHLRTFRIEKASGSYKYDGAPGPTLNNTTARYILVTALSNWGDTECTGLSEIRFGVSEVTSTEPDPSLIDSKLVVIPNPVEDVANISLRGSELPDQLALFDVSGKLLQRRNQPKSMNVQFDMKGLSGGIYVVKAWIGEQVLSEKIVKID